MDAPAVSLSVNGRPVTTPRHRLLLEVLRELGVRVPTLCHDDRLAPYGGCRLCVVERKDGAGGLVPACSTPVQDGMVIETDSPAVVESRQQQLQLLALNHRMDCPVCERGSDCRLQDLIHEIGIPEDTLPFDFAPVPRDETSPVIIRDPSRCVVCGRCVRLCEEVQGVAALGFVGRGLTTRVAPFLDRPLDCEFCGQCVNACPVGALVARPYASTVPAWQRLRVRTTCSFCACGCEISVETHKGRMERVTADPQSPHNRGKLCVRGWLGLDVVHSPERLLRPLVRRGDGLVEADWKEALAVAADGLRRAAGRGPVVAVGGGRLSCEAGYLLQALAREVLRTPHVDCAPVGGAEALVDGVWEVFDRPRSSAGFDDLRAADLVLVLGTDPTRSHPLVKTELVQASIRRSLPVVVALPVAGGLDRHAADTLRLAPGSAHDLLCAVAARLLEKNDGRAGGAEVLPGFEEWRRSIVRFSPESVVRATGVSIAQVDRLVSRLEGACRPVIVLGTGSGVPGDEASEARAAASLVAVLGTGAGLLVLGGRPNVQGLVDVGLHPRLLPGHRRVELAAEVEALTGRGTVAEEGWSVERWVGQPVAASGLLLVGFDPIDLMPRGRDPRPALDRAGFTVVVDAFRSRTAERADVVLPAAILAEREGTTVGGDGVRRPLRRALEPPSGASPDTTILVELARRMGASLPSGPELDRELDRVVGWGWGRSRPRRLAPASQPQAAAVATGFVLDAAPQLFHSGSVTMRSTLLQELSPTVALRLHPADARSLGVARGEVVAIASPRGEVLLRARPDRSVRRGTVVVPWAGSRNGASNLFDDAHEALSVKVRKA
ncbi:MAG: molybdopterin-dependent oxidoreductase [Thermoanaerobaculales bacterium]|jgi:predicted molibdopterin-dependent oxidoreductase YjgC|nr:molybdopterin-dependent oxidoreductase [Thermoanaerobaculales bacterium]